MFFREYREISKSTYFCQTKKFSIPYLYKFRYT